MAAIVVEELVKDYGNLRAVDRLSFSIREGEIFALLGPNGAGKTTTVEILEGHRHRTSGRVSVLGHDPATAGRALRERMGIGRAAQVPTLLEPILIEADELEADPFA